MKFFEISLELFKGKAIGKIVERDWSLSSWIFGESGLAWLLERWKYYYEGNYRESFRRVWNEDGSGYELEFQNNKVGIFLLCSSLFAEEKRFSLVFLEGKELFIGWKILATKLRSNGVFLHLRSLLLSGLRRREGISI